MPDIPAAKFLPPSYANDGDGIDDDVYALRCWQSGCPLEQWIKGHNERNDSSVITGSVSGPTV